MKIRMDTREFDIETGALTLVVPGAGVTSKIHYPPDHWPLTANDNYEWIGIVQALHPEFHDYFKMVVKGHDPATPLSEIRQYGFGLRALAGLVDRSLRLQDRHQRFAWIYPESGLHPALCCELADLAIAFMNRTPRP